MKSMIAGLVGLLGCGQESQEQKEKVAVAANIHYTKESEIPGAYMRQPAAENPKREIAILDLGGHPAAAYRCPRVYIIQHDATLIDNSRHSGEYSTFIDVTPANPHEAEHCHDIEARISPDGLQAAVAVIHRRTRDDIAQGFHPEEPYVALTWDNTSIDYFKINSCEGDYSKSKPFFRDHSVADERYIKQRSKGEAITVDNLLTKFSFVQVPEDPKQEWRLTYQVWRNCDFFPAKSKGYCMNDSPRPEGVHLVFRDQNDESKGVQLQYEPVTGCK